jgi:hypothetical protein
VIFFPCFGWLVIVRSGMAMEAAPVIRFTGPSKLRAP